MRKLNVVSNQGSEDTVNYYYIRLFKLRRRQRSETFTVDRQNVSLINTFIRYSWYQWLAK